MKQRLAREINLRCQIYRQIRRWRVGIGIRVHADYPLHCGRANAPWRSLSAIIGDAARAFQRLAPMAFAEASAHALVAHDASDQVTAAARQAYMDRLPRIRP